jgi:hypothetical protein
MPRQAVIPALARAGIPNSSLESPRCLADGLTRRLLRGL